MITGKLNVEKFFETFAKILSDKYNADISITVRKKDDAELKRGKLC